MSGSSTNAFASGLSNKSGGMRKSLTKIFSQRERLLFRVSYKPQSQIAPLCNKFVDLGTHYDIIPTINSLSMRALGAARLLSETPAGTGTLSRLL